MIWFTSDTHFGHANIIKYCNRPFANVAEMDEALIHNWNTRVSGDDVVYHLGDVAFASPQRTQELLARLNGRKILIRGNHDRSATRMVEMGFAEAHAALGIGAFYARHVPPAYGEALPLADAYLCGHVHTEFKAKTTWVSRRPLINVGVDVWCYAPVSYQELLQASAAGSTS